MENMMNVNKKKYKKDHLKNKLFNINDATYQEKLLLALAFLAIIVVLMFVLKPLTKDKNNVNYEKISASDLFEEGFLNDEREVYWILNDIIYSFVTSYEEEITGYVQEQNNKKYTRKEFYTVLSDEYKEKLSQKQYMEVSEKMLKKFVISKNSVRTSNFIKEVRKLSTNDYNTNMYMCKLNTETNEDSYIGIRIYPSTNNYEIFYLE